MAVDVLHHHVSPAEAYAKMAFGQKSRSTEELNMETAYPKVVATSASENSGNAAGQSQRPNSGSDKSSIGSLMDFSLIERSEMAVEQLVASRQQLESEIEVSRVWSRGGFEPWCCNMQGLVKELTEYGEHMNCRDECAQVLQDRSAP